MGGFAALAAALGVGLGRGQAPPEAGARQVGNPASATLMPRGAGSCSATACHGGVRPLPAPARVLRNESTTWITRDKHAGAFDVLGSERSRSIARNLGGPDADKDPRCLACHAAPLASPADGPAWLLSDGVSCESCHGNARRWLGPHTERGWAGRSADEKAACGMTDTADLVRRAKACASCHVGQPSRDGLPARDVNHDLIAAGHPRLTFEFSASMANMPAHWRTDVGPDAAPDFPARAWLIGQVVSAQAALDLLRARAGGRSAPWPELAEYGCFSCHHDLDDARWRRDPKIITTPPGRNRWGTWHYPLLEAVAVADPDPRARAVASGLRDLRSLMGGPRPDPGRVASRAGAVSEALGAWLTGLSGRPLDAGRVAGLEATVDALQARGEIRGWDEAAQRYLALVPLAQALEALPTGRPNPRPKRDLERLRDALNYRPGFDSPKSFDPTAPLAPSRR